MHLRDGPEGSRRQVHEAPDVGPELHEDREGSVVLRPRLPLDAVGDFPLDHQGGIGDAGPRRDAPRAA